MINKLPPFKGLNIRIPLIIHIKGRGCINQGSGLVLCGGPWADFEGDDVAFVSASFQLLWP